jgi:hypothetical protein
MADRCRACTIEDGIRTKEVPHPVDRRLHTCVEQERLHGSERRLLHIISEEMEGESPLCERTPFEKRLIEMRRLGLIRLEVTDLGFDRLAEHHLRKKESAR